MNSKEFIINNIDNLVLMFPNIKCRYEFDGNDDTHTIEVTPDEFYHSGGRLLEIEREIILGFIELFPAEGLFFVTDKSRFPVQNPIYVKCGVNFGKLPILAMDISDNYKMPKIVYIGGQGENNFAMAA